MEKQPQLSEIQTKRIIAVISKELDEFHNHPKYSAFKKMPPSQLTKAKVDTIITLVTDTFSRIGNRFRANIHHIANFYQTSDFILHL